MTDAKDVTPIIQKLREFVEDGYDGTFGTVAMHGSSVIGGRVSALLAEIDTLTRERDAARQDAERSCQWREDDSDFDTWKTGCGHLWQFNTGGPKENGTKFCQYCGGALTAALTPEDA